MRTTILKNYKKAIFIFILVGILISLFLISKNHINKITEIGLMKKLTEFSVSVDGEKIQKEENNFIYSSTLLPKFNIFIPFGIDVKSLSLKIDNSEDVLMDEFYGETRWDEVRRSLIFQPSYMLRPEKHRLGVEYQNADGEQVSLNFNFILVFNEKFDGPLRNSRVWIVPENRSPYWFIVQEGKLLAKPNTDDNLSSLAFLYTFKKDLTVDFELMPVKNRVSLIFYFLEFGSFTLGSNNNRTILLIREGQPNLFGKNFELLQGHRYHIRVTRKDFEYELAAKELLDSQELDPTDTFLEENVLLNYVDMNVLANNQSTLKQNHIGFSLWGNSDGVSIDNIFITGFVNQF